MARGWIKTRKLRVAQGEESGEPSDAARVGGRSVTNRGAMFEIKVDGVTRSYRDVRETAIEAAQFLTEGLDDGDCPPASDARVRCPLKQMPEAPDGLVTEFL